MAMLDSYIVVGCYDGCQFVTAIGYVLLNPVKCIILTVVVLLSLVITLKILNLV